ncbi:MAG: hypothetical protein KBI20_07800, partial [Sedimentibacter sp.]|nr:hypothetical protein [Sedimentibacter sp.]
MSAFLGPIHFWLYDKIKIQNEIVEEILDYAEKDNINLRSDLYGRFGDGVLKPLDEVIDVTNIHGWLQERVTQVERKLAYLVTKLVDKNPVNFDVIKDIFKSKGAEVSNLDMNSSLEEAYKVINDALLDGMPCDRANSVISSKENEIIWKRNICVHRQYWDEVGGNIENFYNLRDEFIKGLLSET